MHPQDGRVVSNFVVAALSGEPLTIYGDGNQTRSFCYVDDLVDGLIKMMNSGSEVTGPVNLGNPNEFTIAELADQVKASVGREVVLEFRALPQDDPVRRQPDITRARQQLDWSPSITLTEGLVRTIAYFEETLA